MKISWQTYLILNKEKKSDGHEVQPEKYQEDNDTGQRHNVLDNKAADTTKVNLIK